MIRRQKQPPPCSIAEQGFRKVCAFPIYDGPTEVHKWSLEKKIKREHLPKE